MRASRIDATVRRWKRRFAAKGVKLALVVVDYLQLVQSDEREHNLYTVVTKVSQSLKATMKKNEVPGLVLAQLSRKVEEREDKRPHLADLRDSGSIEQDADGVCFLFRHEYYLETAEPDAASTDPKTVEARAKWERAMEACRGRLEFIVAKRRGRRIGIGYGRWHGAFQAIR
jgi:replicative DNA helicase